MASRMTATVIALMALLLPLSAICGTDGFHVITPASFDKKIDVSVSGKDRGYYLVEQGGTLELKVKGPSTLKIISRAVLASAADSGSYSYLTLRGDSRKTLTVSHKSGVSEQAAIPSMKDKAVGESRTKLIEVPRGEQTYTISLPKDAKKSVLFRFALETNAFTKGTPVVAMTPASFTTEVDLVTREETAAYYRVGTGHDVSLKLIGPATLKVLSRVEYDANMNGTQKWKIQVLEDGKVKGTYSLKSRKSEVTSYKEASPLVASRAETFFVEIPAGEHTYEFKLPENHRTVLTRFLLPKTELVKE